MFDMEQLLNTNKVLCGRLLSGELYDLEKSWKGTPNVELLVNLWRTLGKLGLDDSMDATLKRNRISTTGKNGYIVPVGFGKKISSNQVSVIELELQRLTVIIPDQKAYYYDGKIYTSKKISKEEIEFAIRIVSPDEDLKMEILSINKNSIITWTIDDFLQASNILNFQISGIVNIFKAIGIKIIDTTPIYDELKCLVDLSVGVTCYKDGYSYDFNSLNELDIELGLKTKEIDTTSLFM